MERKNLITIYDLSEEEKKNMLKEIEIFYEEVREEKIGIIGSEQVLEFFLENLGNKIYNKALDDALIWYKKLQDNIESDFYTLYKE